MLRSARSARFRPRPEERAARGRELRLIPDHAGLDAIDIRNMSEAESHRIGCAGLPLLRRIGGARVRPHQHGDRTCQHQADSKTTEDDRHDDFPRLSELSVRVSAFSWLHRSSHQAAPITPPRRHRRVARSARFPRPAWNEAGGHRLCTWRPMFASLLNEYDPEDRS